MVNTPRIWKTINNVGAVLGILAAFISFWLFLKVDKIEELALQARTWTVNIKITEPRDGDSVSGVAVRVEGKIEFRTLASESESPPRVNLALAQNNVEVVCYLRSLSGSDGLYVQYTPIISQNGDFECLVFPEQGEINQKPIDHQVVVLAIPEGELSEANRQSILPFYYAPSNNVIMKVSP